MCAQTLDLYNARQKEAITATNGPILVISGAGTGKTHLLTGRILYMIFEKGISPEQILALTFTEKATEEMTQMVDAELPLGHPEICIKTFHAFCETVLRERGHEIGLPLDYQILQEADLWLFLKRRAADFSLDYYRSLTDPQKFLRAMQGYFSRLQDEDITPESYVDYAQKAAKRQKQKQTRSLPRNIWNLQKPTKPI